MPYRTPANAATKQTIAAQLDQRAADILDVMQGDHTPGDRVAFLTAAVAGATEFGTEAIRSAAVALVKGEAAPADIDPALTAALQAAALRLPT